MTKKILIVDDEEDIAKTTRLALESERYEIITAFNGEDALRIARHGRIDLLVIDLMLPDINGNEVVCMLKNDEQYKYIPIIVITALSQPGDEELINKSGVDFYFKKPFDPDQLSDKIKELLKASRHSDHPRYP